MQTASLDPDVGPPGGGAEIHTSAGGAVRRLQDGRLAFHLPGLFVTAVLVGLSGFYVVGAAMMALGAALEAAPALLLGSALGLGFAAAVRLVVRHRWQRMGVFVVDAEAGWVTQYRRGARLDGWPLEGVTFRRRWDPFTQSG